MEAKAGSCPPPPGAFWSRRSSPQPWAPWSGEGWQPRPSSGALNHYTSWSQSLIFCLVVELEEENIHLYCAVRTHFQTYPNPFFSCLVVAPSDTDIFILPLGPLKAFLPGMYRLRLGYLPSDRPTQSWHLPPGRSPHNCAQD